MKLQFRTKDGVYMLDLIGQLAAAQLDNLKDDSSFEKCQKTFKDHTYDCLEATEDVTLTFMRVIKVILSKGDYIKIINF